MWGFFTAVLQLTLIPYEVNFSSLLSEVQRYANLQFIFPSENSMFLSLSN